MGDYTNCAECEHRLCLDGEDCPDFRGQVLKLYREPDLFKITRASAALEGRYYMKLTRLEEVIRFSQEMGYTHLGIGFCIGMAEEAQLLGTILKNHFQVSSVCCKVCGVEKDELGLEKIHEGEPEIMCNPIAQALVLNQAGTDLNVLLGLCVGHDILFTRHCKAPVTALIVKDRPLGHNPAAALYSRYLRDRILDSSKRSGEGP
jgi:uncharacterized metal-binding protein